MCIRDRCCHGSPISLVVANVYMEKFERRAFSSAPLKPRYWFRYVDDTFVMWNHREKDSAGFWHTSIVFTCGSSSPWKERQTINWPSVLSWFLEGPMAAYVTKYTGNQHTRTDTSTSCPITIRVKNEQF